MKSPSPLFLALIPLLFVSCASFYYTAGPFGYENVPIPVMAEEEGQEDKVISEMSLHLKGNKTIALHSEEDGAAFGQAGILYTVYSPKGESTRLIYSAGASAWGGTTNIVYNERHENFSDGMLPGNFPFYGASAQLALGLRYKNLMLGHGRFLLSGLFSWEDGPWARARRALAALDTEDRVIYANNSPSPFSAQIIMEAGSEFQLGNRQTLYLGSEFGYGWPDATKIDISWILYGTQLQFRSDRLTLYGVYRAFFPLNQSMNVGLIFNL